MRRKHTTRDETDEDKFAGRCESTRFVDVSNIGFLRSRYFDESGERRDLAIKMSDGANAKSSMCEPPGW